ncbi:LysM peptidoglycan-binding domain-containing protein [Micromonospora sp. HK10]|uniref:LysM peptidoglycan-binding domain-containing protein n=1 Tax=Micromonospora sp. HK10 TaxID=1538294 RepID=UPI00062745ED|nr:LysM domain-containing protein [Micromonospora sp. HK10]KKK05223.1 peptidoglycan-binding protein [Micromonospora sp. HK10]
MSAPQRSAARRAGQVLTGLGALVVLCAVVVGGPVALLAFAGNPLPDHLPTLAELGTALTTRDDGGLFLRALAVVGWFGWATFTFSVLVELLAAALRRPAPRLPGMGRQQRAAAALVGSVALILAASPVAASAATLAAPQPVAAAPAVVAPQPVAAAPAMVAPPAGPAAEPVRAASVTTEPAVYRVAKGDYLGGVADRYLDDFERYREVARLNRIADPDRIHPGQLLKLPERAVDGGVRRHATGRLVVDPSRPPAGTPDGSVTPGGTGGKPGDTGGKPGGTGGKSGGTTRTPDGSATTPGNSTRTPGGSATTPGTTTAPGGGSGTTSVGGGAGTTTAPDPAGSSAARPAPTRPGVTRPDPADPTAAPTATPGSAVAVPAGPPPAMAAGASRATVDDGMNRPLAISAVLAVASIVGAQIGAMLGLRRRPAPRTATRDLVTGRHRKD